MTAPRSFILLLLFGVKVGAVSAESPPPPAASDWTTRSWQTEDGLPQDSVNAIVQTRDGFLWVGTSAGLARFDGVRFRKFGLQDGLRSVRVTALAEDRQGALWVGTSGGGVSRWENGTLHEFRRGGRIPGRPEVIALAADRDGSVWIGTDKGLVRWSDGDVQNHGRSGGLAAEASPRAAAGFAGDALGVGDFGRSVPRHEWPVRAGGGRRSGARQRL